MSSRRPPATVYTTKRRQRSISNPHSRPVLSSSPVKPLAHDADTSIEEMSRRMMKRSRSNLKRSSSGTDTFKSASVGASPIDRPLEDARPAKRSKANERPPLQTIVEPSHNANEENTQLDGTADMDLTDVAQLKTPVPRGDAPTGKPEDPLTIEESDVLSPLPSSRLAKRVLAHRTSSSNLAENRKKKSDTGSMLLSPANDLASPFSSRPGSPSTNRDALKNALNKKLNRTRSVGTDLRRRATLRSASRAVSPASNVSSPGSRRHPSLPNSQGSQKENQDWFVPAQIKRQEGRTISRKPSETSIPFVREGSFFDSVPEACSTPVHSRRRSLIVPQTPGRDLDATPRVTCGPRPVATNMLEQHNFMLDEPTPRARPSLVTSDFRVGETEDSIFPDSPTIPIGEPNRRLVVSSTHRTTRDGILSADMGRSISATGDTVSGGLSQVGISDRTVVNPESATLAPPASPVGDLSPASSDGDELRDMFSILGLDEDEHWLMTSNSSHLLSIALPLESASTAPKKKTKSSLSLQTDGTKREIVKPKAPGLRASLARRGAQQRRRVLISADSPPARAASKTPSQKQVRSRPVIKMKVLDEPIEPTSDSSDPIDFLKTRRHTSD